jgi:hypothetical protein
MSILLLSDFQGLSCQAKRTRLLGGRHFHQQRIGTYVGIGNLIAQLQLHNVKNMLHGTLKPLQVRPNTHNTNPFISACSSF